MYVFYMSLFNSEGKEFSIYEDCVAVVPNVLDYNIWW